MHLTGVLPLHYVRGFYYRATKREAGPRPMSTSDVGATTEPLDSIAVVPNRAVGVRPVRVELTSQPWKGRGIPLPHGRSNRKWARLDLNQRSRGPHPRVFDQTRPPARSGSKLTSLGFCVYFYLWSTNHHLNAQDVNLKVESSKNLVIEASSTVSGAEHSSQKTVNFLSPRKSAVLTARVLSSTESSRTPGREFEDTDVTSVTKHSVALRSRTHRLREHSHSFSVG